MDGLAYAQNGSSYPHSIEYVNDSKGIAFTQLNFSFQQGNPEFDSGKSVYAEVRQISGRYRGIIDVIQQILTEYSSFGQDGLDLSLFAKARAKIGMIELQTLINGSDSDNATTATKFVEETICNQLPMLSMAYTENGLRCCCDRSEC